MPKNYMYPVTVTIILTFAACAAAQLPMISTATALPPEQAAAETTVTTSVEPVASIAATSDSSAPETATAATTTVLATSLTGSELEDPAGLVLLDAPDASPTTSSSWVVGTACQGVMHGEWRESPPELSGWLVASMIPRSYWLATCFICLAESWCQPKRTHRNSNGTVDYGIMQVNSGNFGALRAKGYDLPADALDPVRGLNLAWEWAKLVGGDYSRPGQWATLGMARRASWCQYGRIVDGLGTQSSYTC